MMDEMLLEQRIVNDALPKSYLQKDADAMAEAEGLRDPVHNRPARKVPEKLENAA